MLSQADLIFYTLIVIIIGIVSYAFYKWATFNNDYFAKRNIKFCKPRFLIGNVLGLFFKRYIPADFSDMIYYQFPNEKCVICQPYNWQV